MNVHQKYERVFGDVHLNMVASELFRCFEFVAIHVDFEN